MDITRRETLSMTGAAALAALLPRNVSTAAIAAPASTASARPSLTIFSRHLHWASVEEAIEVAAAAGFGGIAWTIRTYAHIQPQHVARDLPRVVALTHRAGLGTPHIVTSITSVESPHAEAIVETASGLGIRVYRMQTARYDYSKDLPAQLEAVRARAAALARLNARHGATAVIHTHGGLVGGGVWDTLIALRDIDPDRIAINFDTGYGLAQTGQGWMEATRFAQRYLRFISLKDFLWQPHPGNGRATLVPEICLPGQGVVDFAAVFRQLKSAGFQGPAEVQFEYPIPVPGSSAQVQMEAEYGKWQLEIPKSDFIALLKRDVDFYVARMQEAGLFPAPGRAVPASQVAL